MTETSNSLVISANVSILGGTSVPLTAAPIVASAFALASTSIFKRALTGGHEMLSSTRLNCLSTLTGGKLSDFLESTLFKSWIAAKEETNQPPLSHEDGRKLTPNSISNKIKGATLIYPAVHTTSLLGIRGDIYFTSSTRNIGGANGKIDGTSRPPRSVDGFEIRDYGQTSNLRRILTSSKGRSNIRWDRLVLGHPCFGNNCECVLTTLGGAE